jgi:alpha-tubulin suppressor-like RCC1 family protein
VQISKIDSPAFICVRTDESGTQRVRCAGVNSNGQIADTTTTNRSTFANVVGISDSVTQLAVGRTSACALTASTLFCWGENGSGQLGLGDILRRLQATVVVSSHNIIRLVAGNDTVCALLAPGSVTCWGRAASNSLGNGTSSNNLTYPGVTANLALTGGQAVTNLRGGFSHFCVELNDLTFKCWGNAANVGQLWAQTPSTTQAASNLLTGVSFVRPTYNSTCVLSGSPELLACSGSSAWVSCSSWP